MCFRVHEWMGTRGRISLSFSLSPETSYCAITIFPIRNLRRLWSIYCNSLSMLINFVMVANIWRMQHDQNCKYQNEEREQENLFFVENLINLYPPFNHFVVSLDIMNDEFSPLFPPSFTVDMDLHCFWQNKFAYHSMGVCVCVWVSPQPKKNLSL